MNIESIIALVTVVGTLLTGVGTYLATRSSIRNSQRQLSIEERSSDVSVSVSAAEKLGNLSLAMAVNAQGQLEECVKDRERYRIDAEQWRLQVASIRVRLNKIIIRLQNMHDAHEDLSEKYNMQACQGFPILQKMILDTILDIQKELDDGSPP